jgi:putative hydrolase of the HAD superfamily
MSAERCDSWRDIKGVVLDYGQVLVPCPTMQEFGRMAKMFNVSFESFYELWEASRGPYDCGDLTAEEYWLKLAAETSTSLSGEQIEILRQVEIEIWAHPDAGMLDWLSRLHADGIKTALLSNMPLDLMKHVLANFRWMENFSFKTFSADVRLIKPDPAIYEYTLHGLGVEPAETLFVDDRETNIRAARTLGMHAVQFRSIAQLRDELVEKGFPILPTIVESSSEERPGQEIKFQL